MTTLVRGKTSPASNSGSFTTYAHGIPDLEISLETSQERGHCERCGHPCAPADLIAGRCERCARRTGLEAVQAINQAISEWNQAFPHGSVAESQEVLMARALQIQQARRYGLPVPSPVWS